LQSFAIGIAAIISLDIDRSCARVTAAILGAGALDILTQPSPAAIRDHLRS